MRAASAVLLALGLLGVGWFACDRLGSWLFQTWAARQLAPGAGPPIPAWLDGWLGASHPDSALARLEIPRLGLASMIVDGIDAASLRRGVGVIPGSPPWGEVGNLGLAAHRDTFFRALERVVAGDTVRVRTDRTESRYVVEWTRVVGPDAVEVLRPTPSPALTLVTCFPFRYIGPAPQRFVVRARGIGGLPFNRARSARRDRG